MCKPAESLFKVGIEYNKEVGLIICALCRSAISEGGKEVAMHFKRIHGTSIPTKMLETTLASLEFGAPEALQKYLQPTQELLKPVDGIEIKAGFSCPHCAYFTPLKDTMKWHLRVNHQDNGADLTSMQCMVQSLRGGVRTRYFGVIGETNQYSSYTDEAADAVDRALSEFTNTHLHISPSDDRLVSPFLRRMKWHEAIHERCTENIAAIIESVKFDAESEILKLVYPVVCCYWDIGQELIGTREYLFERTFSSVGNEIVPASAIGRIQGSGAEYCKVIAALLDMIDTHAKRSVILSSDTESNKMAEKIEILVSSCSSAFVGTIFDEYRVEDVSVDQLQLLDNILEMIFRINLEEEHSPSEFYSFPTHRFLVCASINGETQDASGYVQFKQPSQITSLVAILKYWARLAALMNLHQQTWGVEGDETNGATRVRAEALSFYLKNGYRTPFNSLQEVVSFGSCIAMAPEQRRLPQIVWLDSTVEALLVEGHRVTLGTLVQVKTQLVSKFCRVMRDNGLLGFDLTTIEAYLKADKQCCYDGFSNYSCGYSSSIYWNITPAVFFLTVIYQREEV